MALDQDQIDELKSCYSNLAVVEDGGTNYILIPSLPLPTGCNPESVGALLCPTPRDRYPSRLFLTEKIAHNGPGINWNANGVMIAGRQWWAVSWHTHNNNQRLLGMVTAHLQAFTCKQS